MLFKPDKKQGAKDEAVEAIARLNQAGYRVVVATNQSGVGRGLFGMTTLTEIHDKMFKSLHQVGGRIDAVFYCPHAADSNCDCRKPKPGMLRRAEREFGIDLRRSYVVGDRMIDMQAGQSVGAAAILVRTGYGEAELELCRRENVKPDGVADDLFAAVQHIEALVDSSARHIS